MIESLTNDNLLAFSAELFSCLNASVSCVIKFNPYILDSNFCFDK